MVLRNVILMTLAVVLLAMGVALMAGGLWLIALGGSWYYALSGLAFLASSILLFRRDERALWVFCFVTAGTLVWSLWEVGLDWWPLAARGSIIFVIGAILLTPWIAGSLARRGSASSRLRQGSAWRGGGLALSIVLCAALLVAAASWTTDPHRLVAKATSVSKATPDPAAVAAQDVPPGEWHAYGRAGRGQRYSPLDQITPQNAGKLQVAWTYHTGDMRGRPGDPEETTFEVTPLKIGDRLYLCTPHQSVIALDATTGTEIWRYDPKILDKLALQHLTCRGLSYYPGASDVNQTSARNTVDTAAAPEAATNKPVPDMPIAAADGVPTANCTAKLFMPTADGRLRSIRTVERCAATLAGAPARSIYGPTCRMCGPAPTTPPRRWLSQAAW